jgi:hypothetical protein
MNANNQNMQQAPDDNNVQGAMLEAIDSYFEDLNAQLGKNNLPELGEEDKLVMAQAASNAVMQTNPMMEKVIALLQEIGYDEADVSNVLDELQAIVSTRVMLRLYEGVSEEKRDKIMEMSSEYSPAQLNSIIESVYLNETGQEFQKMTEEMFNSTFEAFYLDMQDAWSEIKTAMQD